MSSKEAKARIKINKLLEEAGWRFFDTEEGKANILLENNIKITEKKLDEFGEDFEHTKNGFIDFLLLDDKGFPIVVLEAKAENKNPLFGKEQARKYAQSQGCRFVILSNGNIHYFWDLERGNPLLISKFPSPDAIQGYANFKPDKNRLIEEIVEEDYIVLTQKPDYKDDPSYKNEATRQEFIIKNKLRFLRKYQLLAVKSIQNAVGEGKDRFLFEMATGTGKTLVSAAIIKLFLRTGNSRRVLFLVDRLELENQAYKAFREYLKNDYKTVIYKENRDDWHKAEIVVSTIQTFLSKNRYKRLFSPDDFDLVISDEAHRSIGGNSRAVFEYFIGYKLGLTATPKNYLKNIDITKLGENDPRQLERRLLLDTYKTFGCADGEPTFRYSLIDGVRDGFLVNPIVVDARTEITTQLLADEGYAVTIQDEDGKDVEEIFDHKDFEKRFFSENTNKAFCKAFMENAIRDPITNEIGKTIVFCVSQNHAAKITQILNEMAHQIFPGKYNSDFAIQVTSSISDAQQFTINFANNNLSGSGNFDPSYKTSKTRVCVTVAMMTTGYDCPDILNLCLMRPIFSPTEFVQIKGRGTRKYNFANDLTDLQRKNQIGDIQKEHFKLFDFFANCEYFEEKFNYDEVLKLPAGANEGSEDNDLTSIVSDAPYEYHSDQVDQVIALEQTIIGTEGMKVDRMYFEKFEKTIVEHPVIRQKADEGKWDELIDYIEKNVFNKPEEYFTLEKLRQSIHIDRRITLREIIEKIFGVIPYFKTKDELLEEEFDKFDSRYLPKEEYFEYAKTVFKAYILDFEFRQIIDSGNFARLNISPYGEAFKKLPAELRKAIPEYIKDNVPLNKFVA
ncbi:DEAD/DEAH box helicase family protein [Calditerrivibrio nitroreducens]|uniref:Type III restriction protein res subunit n=1 Tax=Calditerrivibrio nitroreducens (strain DSM 19672 / NBRC 101217 / Yu37-1) TaxID=768670 RepID=E4TK38_CALNY|nr:DEAD/DEAH box helicase family protein [Calditerrivibrio nitroreducens]ADR19314.1 type III restriction protein res subunit [Calditerrivibrio nitroreducens DSM 19672]